MLPARVDLPGRVSSLLKLEGEQPESQKPTATIYNELDAMRKSIDQENLTARNLRAEAAPEDLAAVVQEALKLTAARHPGLNLAVEHHEHFRPGRPTPTHRDR